MMPESEWNFRVDINVKLGIGAEGYSREHAISMIKSRLKGGVNLITRVTKIEDIPKEASMTGDIPQ